MSDARREIMSKDNRVTIRFSDAQLAAIDKYRAFHLLERSEYIRVTVLDVISRSEKQITDLFKEISELRAENERLSIQNQQLIAFMKGSGGS